MYMAFFFFNSWPHMVMESFFGMVLYTPVNEGTCIVRIGL